MLNLFLLENNLNIKQGKSPGRRNISKGNALLETMIFMPVFLTLIFSILWHAKVLIIRQKLVMASRYGTDLILNDNKDIEEIKNEIKKFLNIEDLDIKIKISKAIPPPAFNPPSSWVEIYCKIDLPVWLGKKICVSARSEILNDTYITLFGIPNEKNNF